MNGWRAGDFFVLCWLLAACQSEAWGRDGPLSRPPAASELAPLTDPAGISTGNRSIDALLGQSPEAAEAASRAAARPQPKPASPRLAEVASAPSPENSLRDALLREAALNAPSRTQEREAADPGAAKLGEVGAQPARSERAPGSDALPEGFLAHLAALVTALRHHRDTLLITAGVLAVLALIFSLSRGAARQPNRPSARGRASTASDRRSGHDRRSAHRGPPASRPGGSERGRA